MLNGKQNLIKLFEPYVSELEIKAATSTLNSKFWASGSGVNQVKNFEKSFTKYVGSRDCIAVNSGSAALHLSLSLFNIKNKEVLVPSLTFVSTVHSIIENGGKPIFIDIDPQTLCISCDEIRKKISKKTGAIITVHFGGIPSNINELHNIAKQYRIPIIEDAAHACGASYENAKIGSHSAAVCFSFHPVKNLAMLTGGAICINGPNYKQKRKILNAERWCGIENRKGYEYDIKRIGWNYYMNEVSAAIGLVQLKQLKKLNNIRKKIAKRYFKELNLEHKMPYSNNCSYHLYWIRVKNRSKFMKKMKSLGIETGIHYNPVHLMTFYYQKGIKLPITEKVGNEIVSVPIHPNLRKEDVDTVISSINRII